jgi:hypothetical protein
MLRLLSQSSEEEESWGVGRRQEDGAAVWRKEIDWINLADDGIRSRAVVCHRSASDAVNRGDPEDQWRDVPVSRSPQLVGTTGTPFLRNSAARRCVCGGGRYCRRVAAPVTRAVPSPTRLPASCVRRSSYRTQDSCGFLQFLSNYTFK